MSRIVVVALLAVLLFAQPASAQPTRVIAFDIPPQSLEPALKQVADAHGISLLYLPDDVKNLTTRGVKGSFTAKEAIDRLIEGTGLVATFDGKNAVAIRPAGGQTQNPTPLAQAPLQGAGASGEPANAAHVEEIVITGTYLRVAPESSPVRVITKEEIIRSGQTSVEQLLQTLPQNVGGGVSQGTFNVSGAGADITQQGGGVNLRGLGQRATLVLVNGNRVAPSGQGSFVDLSLIPLSAVQRIEILTNGASAIYGSDAVGGVVNIILKKNFNGAETDLQAGASTRADGELANVSQLIGKSWSTGHALLSYDYRLQDHVLAGDRNVTAGVPVGSTLLPKERRNSVVGVVGQELSNKLYADVTALYSERKTERDYFDAGSPILNDAHANSQTAALNAGLTYDVSDAWRIKLQGNYSFNKANSSITQVGGIGIENDYQSRNRVADGDLRVDGDLFSIPGGKVKLAIGGNARSETYRSSFITTSQITAHLPAVISIHDQRVEAVYGEALIPIVSSLNSRPGIERFEVSAAGRYERYNDFGSTTNPKVGLLWSPYKGLNFRGSYDTSFRAPLVSELGGTYNAIYFQSSSLTAPGRTSPGGVVLEMLGTNPNLTPETSRTWTGGFDYKSDVVTGLSTSLNYFKTDYENRIAKPPTTSNLGNPAFASLINLHPTLSEVQAILGGAATILDLSGPGFTNGHATPEITSIVLDNRINNNAITNVRGLDFDFKYAFRAGRNDFTLSTGGTYLLSFKTQVTPTSPEVSQINVVYQPTRLKLRSSLDWSRNEWSANVFLNHVNGYSDARFAPSIAVASFTTVDVSLGYQFTHDAPSFLRNVRLGIGVLNALDASPPYISLTSGLTRGVTYDPVNASAMGRFVSVRVAKVW